MADRICDVEDCPRVHYALGYCNLHWRRSRTLGTVDLPARPPILEVLKSRSVWEGDCLVWKASVNEKGYGGIRIGPRPGILWKVHRLAWVERHGPIPPETPFVLHRCDNPPCWADEHLFLGTVADNSADMVTKGRSLTGDRHVSVRHPDRVSKGVNHYHARLTVAAVLRIREQHASGRTSTSLGIEFGVSESAIRAVVHRRSWKHVP